MTNKTETAPVAAMMDGTFDPLHGGHIGQLLRAHNVQPFNKAYILVNKEAPHKPKASSWQHRVRMAQLALEAVTGLPFGYEVAATNNTLEFDRQTPIDYKVTGPDSVISDLADPARHEFVTRWRIIILSIPGINGQELEAAVTAAPGSVRNMMEYQFAEESQVPLMNYNFDTGTTMAERVHSTDIRAGGHSGLVPDTVRQYIHDNGLYV